MGDYVVGAPEGEKEGTMQNTDTYLMPAALCTDLSEVDKEQSILIPLHTVQQTKPSINLVIW